MTTVRDHVDLLKLIATQTFKNQGTYVEIGVRNPNDCFHHVPMSHKIGVDPDPNSGATHVMTSDEFFASYDGPSIDLCLIDGDHHCQQVFRDYQNALAHLSPAGRIVGHDSFPEQPGLEDQSFCGDAWRAGAKIAERSDVDTRCIRFDHGVLVIRKAPNAKPAVLGKPMEDLRYEDLHTHAADWMRACSVDVGVAFALRDDANTALQKKTESLCLCVVGKDTDEVAGFLSAHASEIQKHVDELLLISNEGGRFGGLGTIANRGLDATRSTIFGISHADCGYRNGALGIFRDQAAQGKVAGIVGRPLDGRYIWACAGGSEKIAAEISCLDGCGVFFRRDSGLRFDASTFDGFHCVGEDLSLAARSRGIPVIVPEAEADHRSTSNFPDPGQKNANREAWLVDYHGYVQKLKAKWPHLAFLTS